MLLQIQWLWTLVFSHSTFSVHGKFRPRVPVFVISVVPFWGQIGNVLVRLRMHAHSLGFTFVEKMLDLSDMTGTVLGKKAGPLLSRPAS